MFLVIKRILSVILLGISLAPHSTWGMEPLGRNLESDEAFHKFVGGRAVELFKQLNHYSRYPDQQTGEEPHMSGNGWEISTIKKKEQTVLVTYKIDKDSKPSAALQKVFETPNALECLTTCNIVLIKCIAELMGDSFDDLYKRLEAKEANGRLYIGEFMTRFGALLDTSTIKDFSQPGGLVFFKNFPNYLQHNPHGAYSNDNLITVEDGKGGVNYIGFGDESKNGPLSYDGVKKYMIENYNIGFNQAYRSNTPSPINTILSILGFEKGTSFDKVRTHVLTKTKGKSQFFLHDPVLKGIIFDYMQDYSVFCLSLKKITEAKEFLAENK